MNRQQDKKPSSDPKNATQWLLHAYSVGHSEACTCDRCAKAKRDLKKQRQVAA